MTLKFIGLRIVNNKQLYAMFEDDDYKSSYNNSKFVFLNLTNGQFLSKKTAMEEKLWTPSYKNDKIYDWTGDELIISKLESGSGNSGYMEISDNKIISFVFNSLEEIIDDRIKNPR